MDALGASFFLLLLAPLFLLVALAIKLTSRGPVLIAQRRVGAGGEEFSMWKFRSMIGGSVHPQVDSDGTLIKTPNDPRVTRVGKWLRRTSIDELPQLLNVLGGSMSLVGPRPLPAAMLIGEPEMLALRAAARPGITGLWQIRARRKNTAVRDMLPYDLEYIRQCSLWLDLRILLQTVPAVLTGDGAY